VSEAEVELAGLTDTRHQLLLLTLGLVALVGEDLLLGPDLTVVLYMLGDGQVGDGASVHRDGLIAEWTDGDLDIFLVGAATVVIVVVEVIRAEYLTAGVALHRKEIQHSTGRLTAVSPEVG